MDNFRGVSTRSILGRSSGGMGTKPRSQPSLSKGFVLLPRTNFLKWNCMSE